MGWYFRRSIKFGPLRLNLSKSGVGYSYGMKGLRVGTGPRGPYVAGGRYGIYFRQSLRQPTSTDSVPVKAPTDVPSYCTHCRAQILPGNTFCIQCGAKLESSDAQGVFEPERSVHRHPVLWVFVAAVGLIVLIGLFSNNPASAPRSASSQSQPSAPVMPVIPKYKPGTAIQSGPDRLMKLVLRDCGKPSQVRQEGKNMVWEYSRTGYDLTWALPVTKEDKAAHEGGPWLLSLESRKNGTSQPVNDPRSDKRLMPCTKAAVLTQTER